MSNPDSKPRQTASIPVKMTATMHCLRFALWGGDLRSRRILFFIGILASIWPARRPGLLGYLQSSLARAADASGKVLRVSIRPPRHSATSIKTNIALRLGNRADYQSMWECLNREVYAPPKATIHHVLDGGANIGFFSVALLQYPEVSSVVLVEPDPDNLEFLRQNVSSLPNHSIIAAALDEKERTAEFLLADSNTGRLHDAPGHVLASQSISVPCRRLVNLMPGDWDMEHTWLKLDIEGAEYDVLRDMLNGDLRPRAISAELHEYPTAGGTQLVNELEAAGYQVSMMDHGNESNTCRQISALYSRSYSRLVT